MTRRNAILAMVATLAVLVTSALLTAETRALGPAARERVVIKICNWDGLVPDKALDGFQMPAGKWADFQKKGWKVEQYLVAPNSPQGVQGFYAVLCK